MNNKRPVNLDLRTIKPPVTAYTSIFRRISGVVLFLGIVVLLFMPNESSSSEESLEQVRTCLTNPLAKLMIWDLLSALLYHLVAGVRHLITDTSVDETLEDGKRDSRIVIVIAVVLTVLARVWAW